MANLPPTTFVSSISEAKSFSKPSFPKPINQRTPRRSSSRSIKRKKFDDELVESSLKKTSKRVAEQVGPLSFEKERKGMHPAGKAGGKRLKKNKPPQVAKDFGRWRPTDDLALITAVQQTNDLNAVFLGVNFSCHFTLRDIEERWYTLLYDPVTSRLATTAMKQLPPDVIAAAQNNALWSREEEAKLATVPSNSPASLEIFQEFLNKYPAVFHRCRSSKSLRNHWLLMRQYQLLADQAVASADSYMSFSDAEEQIHDAEMLQSRDDNLEQELAIADRRQKREIRQLEDEVPKWQAIVDEVCNSGKSSNEFDHQTLAVLRGRLVRYLMRSREITVGRSTAYSQVDVDLSLEGPAWKVSRKQAVIKLKGDGEYYVQNEGRRPVYIDGKPVVSGTKAKLQHNSTFEICNLRFVFLVNEELTTVNKDTTGIQNPSDTPQN